MKVLVTGASGFIGKHIVNFLLCNTNVSIICSSSSESEAKNTKWYGLVDKYIPFDFFSISNGNDMNLMELFNNPDLLIHLGWNGLPNYYSNIHIEKNLNFGNIFIANLISNGLKNILVTGTCLEYGLKEGEIFETDSCLPNTTYGIAKLAQYFYLKNIAEKNNVNYKWVRLFYMYGEGQNSKSLYTQLINAIECESKEFNMSKGDQIRDFLPISKIAEYLCKLALINGQSGIYNCSSNKPISVLDFIKKIIKEKNANIKLNLGYYDYTDYESFNFWGNNKKLMKEINNYKNYPNQIFKKIKFA